MKSLAGKSVIVTGGGSGIGRATAILLGEAGCLVTIADLNEAGCRETLQGVVAAGGAGQVIRTDVSVERDVEAMVAGALSTFGRLDGACNAAAVGAVNKATVQLSLDDWNRVILVNLTGTFLCLKYQAEAMLRSGGGSIVCVSSTAAVAGVPLAAEYCAAKAGILGLVRAASMDHGKAGLRVNALLPGATRTPMFEAATAGRDLTGFLEATTPIGRFAEPVEIGAAIRWLISGEASFVTGSVMTVDGGYTSI